MSNYDAYLRENLEPYLGEWIAICDEKIVAHGKDVEKVYAKAKATHPRKRPLLALVPGEEEMIL